MSRTIEITTPEQVTIRYELAGFGSRALAALVDAICQLLILLGLSLLFLLVQWIISPGKEAHFWEKMGSSVVVGILVLVVFLVTWGYYIAFETLWNGATPGKRWVGLRVIKDGGHPIDFRAAVVRNLLRAVDCLPGVPMVPIYGVGFIAVLCHGQYKRLGDLAAGTVVVRHGKEEDPRTGVGFGAAEVLRLLDPSALSSLSGLTRDDIRMAQGFMSRRDSLPQPLRAEFARRLATPLMEKMHYTVPEFGVDYERWLDEVDLAYRTNVLGPSPSPTAAVPTVQEVPPPIGTPDETRRW